MIEFIKFFAAEFRIFRQWAREYTKESLMLTSAEPRADQLAGQYQSHTETILSAYLHARRQGLDKGEAWWYVEQWLCNL